MQGLQGRLRRGSIATTTTAATAAGARGLGVALLLLSLLLLLLLLLEGQHLLPRGPVHEQLGAPQHRVPRAPHVHARALLPQHAFRQHGGLGRLHIGIRIVAGIAPLDARRRGGRRRWRHGWRT